MTVNVSLGGTLKKTLPSATVSWAGFVFTRPGMH